MSLEFTALSGVEYYVVIDSEAGHESSFSLTVDCSSSHGTPKP